MRLFLEFTEGLRIALEAVRTNKLRSALATLGIVIGVFTVTLMATAITGLTTAFTNSIAAIGTDVLYIQRFNWGPTEEWWKIRARRPITMDQGQRLAERATMAQAVSFESGTRATVKYEDRTASSVMVTGKIAESGIVSSVVMEEGRFLSEAEVDGARPVCVLGSTLAENLFPYGGSLGEWIRIKNSRYQVIGVVEKVGGFAFADLDNQVTVPLTRLASDLVQNPEVTIAVKIGDPTLLDEAQEELRWIMRTVRKVPLGEDDDFSINNQQSLLDTFGKFTAVAGSAGLFITGLSLFVGGIGIMNVMFVSVTERTQEIGVRKALGAKYRAILTQFLLEAATICVFGGLLALALTWGATLIAQRWLPVKISPMIATLAISVSVITGLVAGFLPANRAARMKPVDALRSE
ncbi:MAG: putative ABC transport system permease protein [Verrucomicrobiales bacterium]|jgi:putative ABC transport system permease protein